jgi:hypothetical protein
VVEWTANLADVVRTIRSAEGVVAMRLHAGILAEALGRPVVMLPYDHKVMELIRQRPAIRYATREVLEDADRLASLIRECIPARGSRPEYPRRALSSGLPRPQPWDNLSLTVNSDGSSSPLSMAAATTPAPAARVAAQSRRSHSL